MRAIVVKGAKEHNLKNIDVVIPRHQMVVVTGLSGSGKSSLVMDTIYAEGQRRYVESLSSYARQFLGLMEKPDVESIEGLSPAIAIDQKSTSQNPRSTVGTITEIYDYLRLLYANIGKVYCPRCNVPISKQSPAKIINTILSDYSGEKVILLAPLIRGKKGEHKEIIRSLMHEGYIRARIDGEIRELSEEIELERYKIHTIEVVADRVKVKKEIRQRITDSVEGALKLGKGLLIVQSDAGDVLFSQHAACLKCRYSYKEISPRLFSFNSPYGACSKCDGLGHIPETDKGRFWMMLKYQKSSSENVKQRIEEKMTALTCPQCQGKRLGIEALSVRIGGCHIADLCDLSIEKAAAFFNDLSLTGKEAVIAEKVVEEIIGRLGFLVNVGLTYLSLGRSARTLSGGEAQRIRLASQIGSGLVDVLYVLDEPSIGLHQRDNAKLLKTLKDLRDSGNTLIIIEHDRETMAAADQIIDLGPAAGTLGGHVVFSGSYTEIKKEKKSLTGQYLSGKKIIFPPQARRRPDGRSLRIFGARENNLKNIDVEFPLGVMTCVTGVSGSGKSSLVNEILLKGLMQKVYRSKEPPGLFDRFEGTEDIDKVVAIDQSPIGRTPRSNPATYTGMFDPVRDLFAALPDAAMRGYAKGRFSFNVKGGRCEACQGSGTMKIEMHFLPDVYVKCEECHTARFNVETLAIKYKGKSISDVLNMTVDEGAAFFVNIPSIKNKLDLLQSVGLGYIGIGQAATTLSGGEAQRIKLAKELSKRGTGNTLYILDEPSTGLHFADIEKLLGVLSRLVDKGNTVIIIEHNLDIIKFADYIIDLGPEGGDGGGALIASGTPEEVAKQKKSYTGRFLKKELQKV
ncbi:excinuclease ABC subunit UvrA [Simkania negevensis]|uniref:UvrABC system protein A n=1 Tax=Simkania negevensis TaxID=83561 RepID=A0ABS3ASQ9_9BACT|nr:excinuclease ABC subunit UvrA [Simkania negevensis]